ncbi:MAG: ATP-dependent Clp protease proteolytic subunit [bacterium]|nr:ATP-dependent Clp protease proteolytic subunit [bacterium]
MTGWKDIQNEIDATKSPEKPNGDFDAVRRGKYRLLSDLTGRPLLVYATAFHNPIKAQFAAPFLSIDISDKDGFNEITQKVKSDNVDVFIHSPGGSAEATESIVKILRNKFNDVRFIITGAAKSAATMLAMSGDVILMDDAAEVGPIDPQVRVGGRFSPAGSIIEQFDRATEILKKNPDQLPVWVPILREFAPALLVECENYLNLSQTLVSSWLEKYMFAGDTKAKQKAKKIAKHLSDEKNFLSHARRVDISELEKIGVKVKKLANEKPEIQDAVKQLHLVVMATLDATNAVKIFENSAGDVLIRMVNVQAVPNSR